MQVDETQSGRLAVWRVTTTLSKRFTEWLTAEAWQAT
jgi:hypothetical protein